MANYCIVYDSRINGEYFGAQKSQLNEPKTLGYISNYIHKLNLKRISHPYILYIIFPLSLQSLPGTWSSIEHYEAYL